MIPNGCIYNGWIYNGWIYTCVGELERSVVFGGERPRDEVRVEGKRDPQDGKGHGVHLVLDRRHLETG